MDRRLRLRELIQKERDEENPQIDLSDMNFQALRPSVIHYGQEQLEILTDGFTNQIGHGGSGRVYKGKALDSEMAIAVKCLKEGEIYIKMWKTELTLLNKFQHKNIINLVGYCPAYPSLAKLS
uniref:Cysteine-rich receptor-like protein kinase 45 n=1 Tax=Elaeis guineensis var. tenera TaxID=51953 RepID=A0A8N4EY89_ELAGV|nr:cysteine-rich receptor-like protein kinase 45 [Elaeis guineensis]